MNTTSTPLTGPHNTQELPLITVDPVTVAVERIPDPRFINEFREVLAELVEKAANAEDCLGATILEGAKETDPYHVIFRFSDAISLRRWEKSLDRINLLEKLNRYTLETSVVTAPSPEAWFKASDVPVEGKVVKWFRDLVWALPLAFTMTFFVTPLWANLPTGMKIIASSAVGIAAYATVVSPLREKWRKRVTSKKPLL